jgi:hypothetical protein
MAHATIPADVRAYLATALWSSSDDDGNNLDAMHTLEDFAPESLAIAAEHVASFRHLAGNVYALAQEYTGYDDSRFMHDLWLTQNGHGAGFWDGDYGPYGDALTKAAKVGETDVYRGDDGLLYLA